ncbi:MAG: PepSY domain-containing protein [Pseudomonadota bacterium]
MNRLPLAVACSLLACLLAAPPAWAAIAVGGGTLDQGESWRTGGRQPLARPYQSGMSLGAAVDLVQRRYGGARVVRAETRQEGGETVHRIRLLSEDGRVFTVSVNARTGRMD